MGRTHAFGLPWGSTAGWLCTAALAVALLGGSFPLRAADPAASPPPPQPTTQPKPEEHEPTGTPRMELSPTDMDFKEVWQGQVVAREFTVKNVGTAALTVSTTSSCGCTVATKVKSPLEPGESSTFKITYSTSHPGKAQKTVTVTTNDPERPSVVINVTGTVKPLVTGRPSDRFFFRDLAPDSIESQTIRLQPRYDAPLKLKLAENQDLGPFTVEFKEVEAGELYELTVTTKPPLPPNTSAKHVLLETGLELVPAVPIQITATVAPPAAVSPQRLAVAGSASKPTEQMVEVRSRLSAPVTITGVKSTMSGVEWEVLPPEEPIAGAKLRVQRVRVKLPAYADIPRGGGNLQISTDAAEQQYRELFVPIVKAPVRAKREGRS